MLKLLKSIIKVFKTLTKFEFSLWLVSIIAIVVSAVFGEFYFPTFFASVMGVSSLIFVARGNVAGHIFGIFFCVLYGWISFNYSYYGEMITYVFMSLPMTIAGLVSWLKNPFEEGKSEVRVEKLGWKKITAICIVAVIVTWIFYYILKYFGTASLPLSTISITTSFLAASLIFFRSPLYAVAYSANDIILVCLWIIASMQNTAYITMAVNFTLFLVSDIYAFYNWNKMHKRQQKAEVEG